MKDLIFLDTETTGNDVKKDRLSQICYQVDGAMHVEYFKPPLPMSVKSMSITHITNKFLEDKKPFEGSGMKKDLEKLFSTGILVAHNARFDKAILEAEGLKIPKTICTLRVARSLDEKNAIPEYNLQYLRYYLDLDVPGSAHDAEGDVNVLIGLFDRLFSKMKEKVGDEKKVIDEMLDISSKPSLFSVFNFGKHKDKKLEDVAREDKGYLEWLLKQKLSAEADDEDWIYTLQYYLKK
ncbi:MAG: hypothetical protein RJA61_683 [Candidatus Parcubacteria bacterium]|jgi:DNA polymerase III epsilon subunit-like protein